MLTERGLLKPLGSVSVEGETVVFFIKLAANNPSATWPPQWRARGHGTSPGHHGRDMRLHDVHGPILVILPFSAFSCCTDNIARIDQARRFPEFNIKFPVTHARRFPEGVSFEKKSLHIYTYIYMYMYMYMYMYIFI